MAGFGEEGAAAAVEGEQRYELDRLLALSDGVFAFALTLLVVQLVIPDLHGSQRADLGRQLAKQFPTYLSCRSANRARDTPIAWRHPHRHPLPAERHLTTDGGRVSASHVRLPGRGVSLSARWCWKAAWRPKKVSVGRVGPLPDEKSGLSDRSPWPVLISTVDR